MPEAASVADVTMLFSSSLMCSIFHLQLNHQHCEVFINKVGECVENGQTFNLEFSSQDQRLSLLIRLTHQTVNKADSNLCGCCDL